MFFCGSLSHSTNAGTDMLSIAGRRPAGNKLKESPQKISGTSEDLTPGTLHGQEFSGSGQTESGKALAFAGNRSWSGN